MVVEVKSVVRWSKVASAATQASAPSFSQGCENGGETHAISPLIPISASEVG